MTRTQAAKAAIRTGMTTAFAAAALAIAAAAPAHAATTAPASATVPAQAASPAQANNATLDTAQAEPLSGSIDIDLLGSDLLDVSL